MPEAMSDDATAVPAAPPHPFATRIPDRRPQFKTHRGIGQAKNAIINKLYGGRAHTDMVIYRLDGVEYKPWIHIHQGQTRHDVPELMPKPTPKTHIRWEIESLARQEQDYLKRAEHAAAKRRELEATL